MAIVTRYFSTTGAGAADGTTWANRAALFSSGNWSSVITGFAFNGADSLVCLIEGGLTYSCGQALDAALFANPPTTTTNFLYLHGCDSSGNMLSVPDADWLSCDPDFSTATLPEIQTSTNIRHGNFGTGCVVHSRLIYFSASAANLGMLSLGSDDVCTMDWCKVLNSHSGTSAICVVGGVLSNCVLECSGTIFNACLEIGYAAFSCRIKGNSAASSGNRFGANVTGQTAFSGLTISDCVVGFRNVTNAASIDRSVIVNCTTGASVSSTTRTAKVTNTIIANCTNGLSLPSGGRLFAANCRLRNNTNNFVNAVNNPTDFNIDTSSGSDAAEFVDYAARNLRNKVGGVTHGKNLGPGDEPAAGGSGGVPLIGSGGLVY